MNKTDVFDRIIMASDIWFETDDGLTVSVQYLEAEPDVNLPEDIDVTVFDQDKNNITFDLDDDKYQEIVRLSWDKLNANMELERSEAALDKYEDEKFDKEFYRHHNIE
jgi:hypothetical protein